MPLNVSIDDIEFEVFHVTKERDNTGAVIGATVSTFIDLKTAGGTLFQRQLAFDWQADFTQQERVQLLNFFQLIKSKARAKLNVA